VINITNRNAQIAREHARNFGVLFLGVGATVAVLGDDRFSDTHASQHCDIYHNGSSGFGGNADIAETADLNAVSHLNAAERRLRVCFAVTSPLGFSSTSCLRRSDRRQKRPSAEGSGQGLERVRSLANSSDRRHPAIFGQKKPSVLHRGLEADRSHFFTDLPASAATENPGGDEVFLYLSCD
jgi:hypothetical protein